MIHGDEDNELCGRIKKAGYVLKYEPSAYVIHKTRDTIKDFLKWSFKRGRAAHFMAPDSLTRLLLGPFSFVWPIVIFFLFLFVVYESTPIITTVFFCMAVLCFTIGVWIISNKGLFPTGRKKISWAHQCHLWISRNKKRGIFEV